MKFIYVIDLTLLLANSLGLGLHQISHFLVACMNKTLVLPTWPRFFLHLGCFCLVIPTCMCSLSVAHTRAICNVSHISYIKEHLVCYKCVTNNTV